MNFKEFQTEQKLRGGYYTPDDLADFLVKWVAAKNPTSILEPSCGDGVFLDKIARHIKQADVQCFELDTTEAAKSTKKAAAIGLEKCQIHNDDFLGWALQSLDKGQPIFDAILGNPPFVRYQYLPSLFQDRASKIFDSLGCKFTKHTNAWVPFILASFALLKPGGRMAMVVPSEIIHVMHAQSLRSYLGEEARRLVVIDPEEIWFEGTLQGAVLLLAEKRHSEQERPEGLGMYPVSGKSFLTLEPDQIFNKPQAINGKTVEGKWTRALLSPATRSLIDGLVANKSVRRFYEIADVDVGIVTGANKFFLVDDQTVERYSLEEWAHPMFGRSEHCPGVVYDKEQHSSNSTKGKPTNFIWLPDNEVENNPYVRKYIQRGEREKLHTRYKCRIRKNWYSVPSVYATEVGMLKRSHDAPRLILNEIKAYTTDTAYRIRVLEGTANQLVFAFINPLTALSAELEGRHYGGGVLELVPSEIEKLLMPCLNGIRPNMQMLDRSVRNLSMDAVLEQQSDKVLGRIGLSKNEQDMFLSGWKALRNRRQRIPSEAA